MNTHAARRTVVALGVVAGVLVTATPAAADTPWTVTDTRPDAPWTVTDASGQRPNPTATAPAARSRYTGTPQRPSGAHRAARRTAPVTRWRPSTTCRTTLGTRWIVGPGDTLDLIARCHPGVTVERLRARNGLRGDLIRVGQVLHVPAAREGLQ